MNTKLLALCALFAAVSLTVRADFVVLEDNFNNASNNLANNDLGIGGGFAAYNANNGINASAIDAFETNGHAVLATSIIAYQNGSTSASLDSINAFPINGGGTTFEFKGVQFSTNTPTLNTGLGNSDIVIFGVCNDSTPGNWYANQLAGLPEGFWIQIMSDSVINGSGTGGWTGTSALFYVDNAGNGTELTNWVFDHLVWTPAGPDDFTPTLDFQLTLSATGWALNITGDNSGGSPISNSGTYAGAGINNGLINGLTSSYLGGYSDCENPGIAMEIKEALVTQLGNLSITTPQFETPQEAYNTDVVLAGETTMLASIVTATGAPTLQWQLENSSSPGTFTNLPNGTATNVTVDTTGLGDSKPRGVRLVGTLGGISVTSAVVELTVNPPSAPVLVQDIEPAGSVSVYAGQGLTFEAVFYGNQPISYNWLHAGPSSSTYTNIPGATNNTYNILSASDADDGSYYVSVSNYLGTAKSSATVVTVIDAVPTYLWSIAVNYGGLTADQILTNFPSNYKVAGAMVAQNGGSPIPVTTSSGEIIRFAPSGGWATVSGGSGFGTGANSYQTGNANFNACLNSFYYDNTQHTIALTGLVKGSNYQVQLFGLDDRGTNIVRLENWADPSNSQDVSVTYTMGANAYVLGNFTASNTVQTIVQNLADANSDGLGNFNCLVLRTVGWNPPPYFTLQPLSQGCYTGNNLSLVAVAAGDNTIANPTITYQWQAGPAGGPYTNLVAGAKYAGTTTTNLTINNLTIADGNVVYVLAASNGAGTQDSSPVTLEVQVAPSIPAAGSYAAYALSYGPVALWMLDDTGDTTNGLALAYDSTGNGHTAFYGTTSQDGYNGILGPEFPTFPGFPTNEYALTLTPNDPNSIVTVPPLDLTNLSTTIACWINPLGTGGYAQGFFFSRNSVGNAQIAGFGYSAGNGTLGYNWNDIGATYGYNSGLAPVVGIWQFAALVIEPNQATFYLYYVDTNTGQTILESAVNPVANTATVTMSAGSTTVIGYDSYANSRVFDGSMCGVALYNKALSQTQMQQLFAAGVGNTLGFPPSIGIQPPANQDVYPGSTVQLIAGGIGGTGTIAYQWEFNNTVLTNGGQFSGVNSNVLTITGVTMNNEGSFDLVLTNTVGMTVSSNEILTVVPLPVATLVGHWLAGAANFADVSGYSPAGTHDAYDLTNGTTYWTNDLPPGATAGSKSLYLTNDGLAISNSSTLDAAYTSTFDDTISNSFSVAFWAKGLPGTWNPWVSKYGEGPGWQFRIGSTGNTPCWTVRDNSAGTFTLGSGPVWDAGGDQDDLHSAVNVDLNWHYYTGTFDAILGVRNLYIDGVLAAQETGNTEYQLAPVEHLCIGAKDSPPGNSFGNWFTGEIYDVRIYTAALSQSQIGSFGKVPPTLSASVIKGASGQPRQLVLTWPFGTLLQATNVLGPWTTNTATSPYTNGLTLPQEYFRAQNP